MPGIQPREPGDHLRLSHGDFGIFLPCLAEIDAYTGDHNDQDQSRDDDVLVHVSPWVPIMPMSRDPASPFATTDGSLIGDRQASKGWLDVSGDSGGGLGNGGPAIPGAARFIKR